MSHPQLRPGYLGFRIGPGGRHEITQADPVVECTGWFLRAVIENSGCSPDYAIGPSEGPSVTRVTFLGEGQSVTYSIGEYDAQRDLYTLHWPD